MRHILCILLFAACSVCPLQGQTYYYERIKTVKNGLSVEDIGDGHFITFNSKGCYDSDRNGMAEKKVFRKYLSCENGIYKYYGDTWKKDKAYYFFSSDKGRLNVCLEEKDVVYVYVKKAAPSGLTAKMRGYRAPSESSGSGSSASAPVFVPVVPPPVVIGGGAGSSGGSGYSGPTSRPCTACNQTGRGWSEIVYAPNYTGNDNSRYCAECGYVSPAHTHIHHKCSVCRGRGYIEY